VALNLKLTFSLLNIIRNPPAEKPLLNIEVGTQLPLFEANFLTSDGTFELAKQQTPSVFLFLSSQCPTCRQKLPQIEALFPLLPDAGLNMYFITLESKSRVQQFLANSPLLDVTIKTNKSSYKKLNPLLSSPFYLFVDHLGQLQAGGMIGDENWLSFISQMEEIETELKASA